MSPPGKDHSVFTSNQLFSQLKFIFKRLMSVFFSVWCGDSTNVSFS